MVTHMHTAAKVVLILGVVFTIVGIGALAIGFSALSEMDDHWNSFELSDATNGTIEIDDSNKSGEWGLTFWVKGKYLDEDNNGYWDVCNETSVTVIENPEVNTSWESAERLDGKFYNEVNWFEYDNQSNCDAVEENKDHSREDKGLVKIGRACWGCYSGTFEFESNKSVWVTYDDKIEENIEGEARGLLVGFGGGGLGICCGIIFLFIGIILIFALDDNKGQEMMYMPPSDNQMIASHPQISVATPTTTHMSQPDFGEPPQGGL